MECGAAHREASRGVSEPTPLPYTLPRTPNSVLPPPPVASSKRSPRRRPPLRALRGLRDGPPREDARRAGARWATATAITLLFFAILGSAVVSVRDLLAPGPSANGEGAPATQAPERIAFVPVPRSSERTVTSPAPASTAPRAEAVFPSLRSRADSGARAGVPIAPPTPLQSDSSTAAPLSRPSTSQPSAVADPRVVFPTAGCDLACRIRKGTGGAVGGGVMTAAERDSMLRDAARRAREAQRLPAESPVGPTPPSTGAPAQQQGGSVAVPLPGGGPSAAERKRNRELDAEVSARLARIKARADSAQRARDSAARKP